MQVEAKVVLILDAASELYTCTRQLAAAGATLVLHHEADVQTLKDQARELHAHGHAPLPILAELGEKVQREALFERIIKICGRLDVLVQAPLPASAFLELTPAELQHELSSLSARLQSLRLAARVMPEGAQLLFVDESPKDAYLAAAYRRYAAGVANTRNVSFRALSPAQLELELSPKPAPTPAPAPIQPQPFNPVRRWFGRRDVVVSMKDL